MNKTDIISINNMQVPCFIGIHRHERHERQMLILDVDMHVNAFPVGAKSSLQHSVDYSKIYGELKFLLETGQFRLLETAAQALSSYLLASPLPDRPQAQIQAVTIKLSKPSALKSEAIPSLKIHRTLNDVNCRHETNHYGEVDIIHESTDCGIYRLLIPAGGKIPAHYHDVMEEGELVLSEGLMLQGRSTPSGLAHFWPQKFIHEYENPTEITRTILCVNRPVFIREDEILVQSSVELIEPPTNIKMRYF